MRCPLSNVERGRGLRAFISQRCLSLDKVSLWIALSSPSRIT
jgi:hypothetical protein